MYPTSIYHIIEIPLFILTATSINLSIFVGYSILMYFVYMGKFAALEQFRVGNVRFMVILGVMAMGEGWSGLAEVS